jgi:3-hydroxy-9,10-secoandrosta-1,3,5(10)-triene-9,17-dione monooxygenase
MSVPPIPRFEHFDFQRSYGRALMLADAAEQLMIRGCDLYADLCRRWAADGAMIETEENMRLWGLLMQAGQMASEAVELLFHTAGTAAMRKGSRLQRYAADVAMYRSHSSAQDLNFASGLARLHFGLPWGMYGL